MDFLKYFELFYLHFIYICRPQIYRNHMKFNLICIGKTDDCEITSLISNYLPRIPKHWNFEIIEIPDVKNAKNLSADLLKKEEGKLFLNQIDNTDLVILLDEIYQRANEKISLSKMTFTHQMIRLFFVEQIYRASTILQGKPYHND